MAHFAKLIKEYTNVVKDDNGQVDEAASSKTYTVEKILVVKNSLLLDSDNNEVEQNGIDFLQSIEPGMYKQCSYNGNLRGKYPSVGDVYNEDTDVFEKPTKP
jgi:hypothetical protein